jgi:hypothetical protein
MEFAEIEILVAILISVLSFIACLYLIKATSPAFISARLCGIDLAKPKPKEGAPPVMSVIFPFFV